MAAIATSFEVEEEIRIPFPNMITSNYQIFRGPKSLNPGGGHHHYVVLATNEKGEVEFKTELHFQEGPLAGPSVIPHNGVLSIVLLAILKDHFKSFQDGEFSSRENSLAITKLEEVIHWVAQRADERSVRNVLGQHKA